MLTTVAATLLQDKEKYYGKVILRQPVIIAWSFHITGKHNFWLQPLDAFVKPKKYAVVLICQEKPAKV
jgi:hypothetical protein